MGTKTPPPKPIDIDAVTAQEIIHRLATVLLRRAHYLGVVVTIELEPKQPLAMRNYRPVVRTRMRR